MHTYLDCFPCFVRQALDAARFATHDEQVHARVVQAVLQLGVQMDMHEPPPVIGQHGHRLIREVTGKDNPYREPKRRSNELALRLCAELERDVAEQVIGAALETAFDGHELSVFADAVAQAHILYPEGQMPGNRQGSRLHR